MRARALALAAVFALGAAFLTRGAGPGPTAPQPASPALRPPSAAPHTAPRVSSSPSRDPFRYADETSPEPPPRAPSARPSTPAAVPAPAVRLIGFVRTASQLRAALAISGEVVVAGPGESAAGYAVLAVDEEAGVRLRAPAGDEILLPPPS